MSPATAAGRWLWASVPLVMTTTASFGFATGAYEVNSPSHAPWPMQVTVLPATVCSGRYALCYVSYFTAPIMSGNILTKLTCQKLLFLSGLVLSSLFYIV